MKAETGKFDRFSKIFTELSDESQDELVKIAHRLLKVHKLPKPEILKQKSSELVAVKVSRPKKDSKS